jgi:hypothetical protein
MSGYSQIRESLWIHTLPSSTGVTFFSRAFCCGKRLHGACHGVAIRSLHGSDGNAVWTEIVARQRDDEPLRPGERDTS